MKTFSWNPTVAGGRFRIVVTSDASKTTSVIEPASSPGTKRHDEAVRWLKRHELYGKVYDCDKESAKEELDSALIREAVSRAGISSGGLYGCFGLWGTADGLFGFSRPDGYDGRWNIESLHHEDWLQRVGLDAATSTFRTRAEAMKALELAIAVDPPSPGYTLPTG